MDTSATAHLRHELRTPLNQIIGYTEMLLEDVGAGQPVLAAALRDIHERARQLVVLVTDALSPGPGHGDVDLARLSPRLAPSAEALERAAGAVRATAGIDAAVIADLEKIATAAAHLHAMVRRTSAAADADRDTSAGPAVASAAPGATDPSAPTILVVDDIAENREMLTRRLVRQGARALQAANGSEALTIVASHPVDLVLLDVMMPEMDGYEVLRRLKADAASRDLPVLMISALDEIESVVRCIELGADDYLPKPFDPVLLRARIGASLEKKRLRDQEKRYLAELADWNRTLERRVQEQVAEVERLGRLRRFFSPQLAEAIVTGGADDPLRTHRREIVVVFLDLRGFTAFAETAEPEEVMGLLREYHATTGRLILEHEGTLERFTGDGMMVFFNDPVSVSNPGERAIRMAVAMRDAVQKLAAGWRRRGYDLGLGVGVAQGYATIGAIGFEGRWDYAAIGTVTNLAARLCGEAHPGQILASRRLLATIEELVNVEPVGELTLKGFARPVPAFNVRGVRA